MLITKSGHHAEKEIGKTLRKIHLLSTLLNLCLLYKELNQNLQIHKNLSDTTPSDITNQIISIEHQRTSTDNTKPKVAESENIGANHLEFAKSLFQHYSFNFYVNEKISSLLRTPVNTESARETFYKELIQNTNLSTNHNFTSIITEINKEIEHHTQQKYPITYTSKAEPIQQLLQLPPQQPVQQQLFQQPPQPHNLDPMAYAPIAKLDNFTGEENDAQVWLNDVEKAIAANGWNDILNQFICGLCSSILQHVRLLHPGTLQDAVTCARDFESAESEANHAQAINLVMNGLSELDSKFEKFSESINKRLEGYLTDNYAIYQPPQHHNNQGNFNRAQNQPCLSSLTNQQWQQETHICYYCRKQGHIQIDCHQLPNSELVPKSKPTRLPTSDAVISLLVSSISTSDLSAAATIHQLIPSFSQQPSGVHQQNSDTGQPQNPNSQNYLSLLVTPEDASTNNPAFTQKQPLTSNISLATITKDESLATIFPFEFEETATMPLFSGTALEAKPITVMYTDAKVKEQSIKLILDSGSTGSIITRQLMNQLGCQVDWAVSARIITADNATKTPIGKIDNFPFKVNGIMTLIKVLVMEATQY
ncbi:hypothetical protein G9A89_013538 [Geosiphon pyriformis]|nr:hypothetical protein G9A89_013538 [Geosiphon pyriformis]